ncbi:conserved repeat domain-containing protein [Monaibacterium marinum]|uniref:Conserved repeat domain-containing protein n=1 Tax=Pontivivens marinum TaxID=1690039 RepID=A0A2C9CSZ0_9RHOB|nr:hypothetical protein [Monaibacterium marinum]SOH94348.1 conserved repeat domain-containing protein [Monaibacterium marinum]
MKHSRNFLLSSSAIVAVSFVGMAALAAPQDAGSVIGNQAVATYTNAAGDTITVTSNKVETIVQQVAGVSMTSDNSEQIAPGGKAFLPHIVTNDGNGPDSFDLSYVDNTGDFNFASVVFYADANLDGVADNATPITETPVLGAGERFGFIVDATAPSTASAADAETLTITAASALTAATTAVNTDTLTVANGAIMELVKSMVVDKSAGDATIIDAGDTIEVTLTYSNTGLAASDTYSVQDIIDTDLPYTVGSAQWSDATVVGGLDETNGTAVDATNGSLDTIAYQYTAGTNTIDFEISEVPAGRTGSVTFEVTIGGTADAGLIENTATQSDNDRAYPPSNTASVTVASQYAHIIDDTFTQTDTTVLTSTTDDGAAGNDEVLETGDVSQGTTIEFEFVIGNNSNQDDSYTLDVANGDFPLGTSFRIVASDGATPVVGSIPLDAGDGAKVFVLATLPSDAAPTASGATNYTATITATSDETGTTNTSVAEFTGAVLAASVDLENTVAGSEGDGAAPTDGGDPWVTEATDPGVPVTFPLNIENQGPTSDSYNLTLNQALPAGWTVEFQLADGSIVTNTGTIGSGDTANITVVVTPAPGSAPVSQLIDINVASPVSGQSDSITNQVTVNEVIDVSIVESQTVQASPNGVVDILHTISNAGNIDIVEGSITAAGLSGFSGTIFWDKNGNGVLDATDEVIDNFNDLTDNIGGTTDGLAAGETISLIYRVQAGALAGSSEVATLTLDSNLNTDTKADRDTTNNTVDDQVVVVTGDVTLSKTQAIDPLCNDNPGAFSAERQDVEPNQCIVYRIEAANTGSTPVTDVIIRDVVPAYTTFETCGGACPAVVTPGTATVDVTGAPNLETDHGTINPGSTGTFEFTVRVDN